MGEVEGALVNGQIGYRVHEGWMVGSKGYDFPSWNEKRNDMSALVVLVDDCIYAWLHLYGK